MRRAVFGRRHCAGAGGLHYAITVAPFDRAALTSRLRDLGVTTLPSTDEPDVFRFADNNGIVVELRVAQ